MPLEVKVPALGESISSGILAAWHVKDGDVVLEGQSLYDLETDKITSEGTAEKAGRISLKANEGDEVAVGSVVAVIDESAAGAAPTGAADVQQRAETEKPELKAVDPKLPTAPAPKPKADAPLAPSVRRLAEETGVDPREVPGTGKGGRVTKGDMLKAGAGQPPEATKEKPPAAAAKAPPPPAPSSTNGRQTRKKMTPLRRTIAQRLVQAQQTTAMLTTFNEVNMEPVMSLRKKHQEAFTERHGVKLGFMSFFTKAVVQALQAVPAINSQIEGEEIVENHYYDIGIAVSTPRGLLVPVVRDCDKKGFADIEKDILAFATRAKDGKIGIEDLQGGVFTITNGGIFGSMMSTPILNQPQSAILGMHTINERPVAENGQVVIRPMMYLALSYDHRVVDGREAVTFLVKVKQAIEDPARLLLAL